MEEEIAEIFKNLYSFDFDPDINEYIEINVSQEALNMYNNWRSKTNISETKLIFKNYTDYIPCTFETTLKGLENGILTIDESWHIDLSFEEQKRQEQHPEFNEQIINQK